MSSPTVSIPIFTNASKVTSLDLPPHSLVFTGTMDFRPNVDAVLWFAREVLPLIKPQVPEVRVYIVGQRPHARLDVLRADPAITITGAVDDTRPYITAASVYHHSAAHGRRHALEVVGGAVTAGAHRQHDAGRRRF